jgi:hypothetical protein
MGRYSPFPWTGSWTGPLDNPSAVSAVSAITRAIGAASAHGARGHTSHNPPVVSSSPTRPTYVRLKKGSICPRLAQPAYRTDAGMVAAMTPAERSAERRKTS